MRVSTLSMNQTGINAILDQQAKANKTQLQLGSGKRILSAADDPSAMSSVLQLNQQSDVNEQYKTNSAMAKSRLNFEESTLGGVVAALQRFRELTLQANNDTQSNETRAMITKELEQVSDQILSLANTKDANGEFIFAGYQGTIQPFLRDASGNVSFQGDQGQRFLQIGPDRQVAIGDSGADVFLSAKNGNGTFSTQANSLNTGTGVIDMGAVTNVAAYDGGIYSISFPVSGSQYQVTDSAGNVVSSGTYTDGGTIAFNGVAVAITGTPNTGDIFTVGPSVKQSLFATVQNIITRMKTSAVTGTDRAQFHNAINHGINDLSRAMDDVVSVQAGVGARLNAIDQQGDLNDQHSIQLQETISTLQDLDYAEAASRLNLQLTGLKAAQQAYVQLQGLSLFNYLK